MDEHIELEEPLYDRHEGRVGLSPDRVAIIRTSDRMVFRRCRRKFNWWYIHRNNLTRKETPGYFWFGTGFHFALEDYHGYRRFPTPGDAFLAYVDACKRTRGFPLPDDLDELTQLGTGMMEYYEDWLQTRDPMVTLEVGGVPQVEVNFEIPIPLDPNLLARYGFDRAVYVGTIDRVVIDDYNRLWLGDYKTAKTIQTDHLDTDPQISAYCWAAQHIYNLPVAGFFYMQFKKQVPHEPSFLKSTGSFSVAKNQDTTYALYRKALINLYSTLDRAPTPNVQFLNWLSTQENEKADAHIRFTDVERNQNQIEAEGLKILQEATEMLNPDLPLYPNPTRDCVWDCGYRTACIEMDSGLDWEQELELTTVDREEEQTQWRTRLRYPEVDQPPPRIHRLR